MLMQDLLPVVDEVPPAGVQPLKEEQEVLHGQREKVTGEVDSLLEQVQHMHHGFVNMKNGFKPRPSHSRSISVPEPPASLQKDLLLYFPPSDSITPGHTPMVY